MCRGWATSLYTSPASSIFNLIQDVTFMPLLYVFFFLSGFSGGMVMGSLVIILIRAKVSN
jgi:hypothetical protein